MQFQGLGATDNIYPRSFQEKVKFTHKWVNRLVGRAIHRYGLLEPDDRILVAVSGGADSLVMLRMLMDWQKKAPINFQLIPCFLNMGFKKGEYWRPLKRHLQGLGLPFHWEETGYGPYAHSSENREKSPCFLCSLLRRKRLFELARAFGCGKVALGHNLDDLIETFFMNVCYSGELSTMVPRQEMFGGLITIIRPLALVEKPRVDRLARQLALPVLENPCPSAGQSRRSTLRHMLQELYRENRKVRGNIRRALSRVRPEYLL